MNYTDYQQKTVIGHGAFGKVYQLKEKYAVKEEYKVVRYYVKCNDMFIILR